MTARREDDLRERRAQRAGRIDIVVGSDPRLILEPVGQMAELVHERAMLRGKQQQQKADWLEQRSHPRRWWRGLVDTGGQILPVRSSAFAVNCDPGVTQLTDNGS